MNCCCTRSAVLGRTCHCVCSQEQEESDKGEEEPEDLLAAGVLELGTLLGELLRVEVAIAVVVAVLEVKWSKSNFLVATKSS